MIRHIIAIAALASILSTPVQAQPNKEPPSVAKMRELGTVYLTWQRPAKKKDGDPKAEAKPNAIIGVDFRPMAGTDPKKIAAAVKELATLSELQSLLLLGVDVDDSVLLAAPTSAKLERMHLYNTRISDKGIAKLDRFVNLNTFSFTGNGLSDEGMKSLGKMKSLTTISIVDAKVTDVGVLALQALPNLISLNVENTQTTAKGLERLREVLPKLKDGFRVLR